jgi:glucose-6-phosphate 1-dehydrogenase
MHPKSTDVPCILVIFGGAGDLSHRKLLPALYNLLVDAELPKKFAIVGFSMEHIDDDTYRKFARTGIEEFSRQKLDEATWDKFAPLLHFVSGTFTEAADYARLRERLDQLDQEVGSAGNHIFYFAIPPAFIDQCSAGLSAGGMINPPDSDNGFTRVVVEKPIGRDLASAIEINSQLARHFDESQIFRIDHYLGKETVENLMVLRFANAIFEPIWSARFIDHVQITVAEQEGVGTRAAYYDHAGALRDMVQSHILQVLCMIASEPPRSTGADAVRDSKLDVIRSLRPYDRADVDRLVVRGQYVEGLVGGEKAKSYRDEEHIEPDSKIETFVALKCYIENWRWAGKRNRHLFQTGPAHPLQRQAGPGLAPELPFDSHSARRGPRPQYHLEGSRTDPAAQSGGYRFSLQDGVARSLRDLAQRRDGRRPDALHAPRYGRGGVALRPGHPRRMGEFRNRPVSVRGRLMGSDRIRPADCARRSRLAHPLRTVQIERSFGESRWFWQTDVLFVGSGFEMYKKGCLALLSWSD